MDDRVQSVASLTAAGADTAPPVVTLSADPADVPWLEQSEVRASAQDDTGVVGLEVLLGDQLLATASEGDLVFDLIPGDLEGMTPGSTYTLTARAVDAAGNIGQAALAVSLSAQPVTPLSDTVISFTATPRATATTFLPHVTAGDAPTAADAAADAARRWRQLPCDRDHPADLSVRRASEPDLGPECGRLPGDCAPSRPYEASNPQPVPTKHRLIVMENRYLRLGILPDLGGRIYEATFKPTGNNEFYSNPVVKPTQWGPANPTGANWWLAAGGLEWGFPVEEHGYEFGRPWGFDNVSLPNGGVMLTLFTRHGPQLPYAVVDVILPPDAAYFVVQPRITNPWGAPFKFKWWGNAMLAPGAANSPGPDLQLIFPASKVTIHSTGERRCPVRASRWRGRFTAAGTQPAQELGRISWCFPAAGHDRQLRRGL